MNIELETIRVHTDTSNVAAYLRSAFVNMGVDPANIKSIHHSPGGFAPRPNRWVVILHKSVHLSAVTVNECEGLSGAVWNGNICHVLVGKE